MTMRMGCVGIGCMRLLTGSLLRRFIPNYRFSAMTNRKGTLRGMGQLGRISTKDSR